LKIQDRTLYVRAKTKLRTEIAKAVRQAGGTVSMFEEEENESAEIVPQKLLKEYKYGSSSMEVHPKKKILST